MRKRKKILNLKIFIPQMTYSHLIQERINPQEISQVLELEGQRDGLIITKSSSAHGTGRSFITSFQISQRKTSLLKSKKIIARLTVMSLQALLLHT